ncbi:BEM_collapsed_G0045610.mRNA.1.CDS.1 [Saccharomyces cerevisiae]|nr:BEM_collapsed_G0045610.mRNA.1.CDS.1 [Saccharomyces cerevisiae]
MVYLLQDEQYLQEDKDEGISMQQFYNWVTSYSNRLVFHQSQAKFQQRGPSGPCNGIFVFDAAR